MVDSQTSSIAFSQLAFNPQCFAVHGNSSLSPEQWNDVRSLIVYYLVISHANIIIMHCMYKCRYQCRFRITVPYLVHHCSSPVWMPAPGYLQMLTQHSTIHFCLTGQSGTLGKYGWMKLLGTLTLHPSFYFCSNDSTNTGYLDPYNPEHSVVTTVHSFSTANQSVSLSDSLYSDVIVFSNSNR